MKFKMKLDNVENEFKKLLQIRDQTTKAQARIAVSAMVNDLKAATPIDTGLARSSWEVSELNKVFVVKNTTDYIQHLNQGSSKQAPSYFIEAIALNYGKPLGTIVEIEQQ
jgi:hypothetical protein